MITYIVAQYLIYRSMVAGQRLKINTK